MLLRNLKIIELKKSIVLKQSNGSRKETFETLKKYKVETQELDDEISSSIYGASIINMLRMKSPLKELETFLKSKVNNTDDNISKYFIFLDNSRYRIKSVNSKGIDCELV